MKPAFISAFFFLFNFHAPQEIVVEHNYLPRIEASSIADEVITFDLEKDYTIIRDLVITEDNYFISPGETESKGFSTSVSKLDKLGNYIEEIYRSKEGGLITNITYDPSTKKLIIAHKKKIILFDIANNKITKEVVLNKNIDGIKIFKNKLYVSGGEYSEALKTYYLASYDPSNLKLIKVEKEIKYKAEPSKPLSSASRYSSLSISNDNLLLSMGQVNEIYSSANGFESPIINFKNIYKNKPSYGNIIFSSNQGLIGKFATTRFKYLNDIYIYFYDLKNNKQYLSKTGSNSGLYDDINNSGFLIPNFSNSNEYMFSSKKNKLNGKGISVILLKIKS